MTALPSPLLVITDRNQARHAMEDIAQAVAQSGGRWLLFRDKDLEPAERRSLAGRLSVIAGRHGMHLSVSRDVDLAAEFGASIHLQSPASVSAARRRLGHGAIIGISAHSRSDVEAAAAAAADYVTLSPIFLTASKPGYGPALGTGALTEAARSGIAIVALGGITIDAARPCLEAGAAGIAAMGEVMRSDDPGGCVRELLAALKP